MNQFMQAIKLPTQGISHSGQVITLTPKGRVMLDKPVAAPAISLLSDRPLTEDQIALGKKIAAKHGLTE